MPSVIDPDAQARLDAGHIRALELIRIDLPGETLAYHRGGRPFTHNGVVYQPNQFLQADSQTLALGSSDADRRITFSGVPSNGVGAGIAEIESKEYLNSPVTISTLIEIPPADLNSDPTYRVIQTTLYQIDSVRFPVSAEAENGEVTLTVEVNLQLPSRVYRDSTGARRNLAEQQFDNNPNDTGLRNLSGQRQVARKWGQITG